jgi:lycopene beta-cyclase
MLSIGTAAGRTKPTTGYTFMPIQQEADAIAASLRQTGIPVPPPAREARFVFYDRLLLWLIRERGGDVHRILLDLFARNRMGDIFRFLDEKSSLGSDAWMLARLPWGPFMQALYACYMPQGTSYHPGTVHVPDHL